MTSAATDSRNGIPRRHVPGNGDASAAIEMGGHVAVGLGDCPYTELGAATNADMVREATRS